MNLKDEIQKYTEDYYLWLKSKTLIKEINNDWIEITTPYLDRHNDYLQIYAKRNNNNFLLTDDGYIIQDLLNSGFSIEGPKREELLRITLAGFGVSLENDHLVVRASSDDFSIKKHSLVQAMLAINDLFYLSTSHAENLFLEDVGSWMKCADIPYIQKIKFSGKSGYDHMFDFVLPEFKAFPERIIQTLNNPKKDSALLLVSKWLDTKDSRPANSKLYAILNDTNQIKPNVIEALENYNLTPILWSERDKIKERLVA